MSGTLVALFDSYRVTFVFKSCYFLIGSSYNTEMYFFNTKKYRQLNDVTYIFLGLIVYILILFILYSRLTV